MGSEHDDPTLGEGEAAGVFLVVVDDSPELSQAMRYACRRSWRSGGRVGLLYVVEPVEFEHWMAVGDLMRHERREEAEETLSAIAAVIEGRTGRTPVLYIREGHVAEELMAVIAEDLSISALVLGAATGDRGPGPLVTYMADTMSGNLRVPITIVPGNMTEAQIDAIT